MLTEDEEAGIRMSRSPSARGGRERTQLIKRHNWMEGSSRRGALEALCYHIEAPQAPEGGITYACSRFKRLQKRVSWDSLKIALGFSVQN
jgi:hypothetical protein